MSQQPVSSDQESSRIPTSLRVIRVLETIAEAGQPLSIQAIGQQLGLAKPTIYRLCNTLLEAGYLVRDLESGFVRPASRTTAMGNGLISTARINLVRKQILTVLSRTIGETCNIAVPQGTGMTYVERVETQWPFRIQLATGTQVPLHCTASGKLFLSSLPRRKKNDLIRSLDLDSQAKNTITNPQALIEETESIARQGYAIDNEEFLDGLVALAVPVRDPNNNFFAALAFHGPLVRLSLDMARSYLDFVQQAARRLEREVFGSEQEQAHSSFPPQPKF